jgi:hypothetical protein
MRGVNFILAIVSVLLSLAVGVQVGSIMLLALSLLIAGCSYVYERYE